MSVGVAVYPNDPTIAMTIVDTPYNLPIEISYGEKHSGYPDKPYYPIDGFESGSYITFEAVPDDGCKFVEWVYRLGDSLEDALTATQQGSTDNPFVYSGDQYIVIRAVGSDGSGSGDTGQYDLTRYDLGELTSMWSKVSTYDIYDRFCASCSFAVDGYVTFTSHGSGDPYGTITIERNPGFDESGFPNEEYEEDFNDDGGDEYNFYCKFPVEANQTYYFWWGPANEEEGRSTIHIIPPNVFSSSKTFVHNGMQWVPCIAFIKTKSGVAWYEAEPHIHNGTEWISCQ